MHQIHVSRHVFSKLCCLFYSITLHLKNSVHRHKYPLHSTFTMFLERLPHSTIPILHKLFSLFNYKHLPRNVTTKILTFLVHQIFIFSAFLQSYKESTGLSFVHISKIPRHRLYNVRHTSPPSAVIQTTTDTTKKRKHHVFFISFFWEITSNFQQLRNTKNENSMILLYPDVSRYFLTIRYHTVSPLSSW